MIDTINVWDYETALDRSGSISSHSAVIELLDDGFSSLFEMHPCSKIINFLPSLFEEHERDIKISEANELIDFLLILQEGRVRTELVIYSTVGNSRAIALGQFTAWLTDCPNEGIKLPKASGEPNPYIRQKLMTVYKDRFANVF